MDIIDNQYEFDQKQKAAALAVALALKWQEKMKQECLPSSTARVSHWQHYQRMSQMNHTGRLKHSRLDLRGRFSMHPAAIQQRSQPERSHHDNPVDETLNKTSP